MADPSQREEMAGVGGQVSDIYGLDRCLLQLIPQNRTPVVPGVTSEAAAVVIERRQEGDR